MEEIICQNLNLLKSYYTNDIEDANVEENKAPISFKILFKNKNEFINSELKNSKKEGIHQK